MGRRRKTVRYYGDFKKDQFNLIEPKAGPTSGSTNIKIYGQGFKSRNVPARLSLPSRDRNQMSKQLSMDIHSLILN